MDDKKKNLDFLIMSDLCLDKTTGGRATEDGQKGSSMGQTGRR